jgi:hypothetical protein
MTYVASKCRDLITHRRGVSRRTGSALVSFTCPLESCYPVSLGEMPLCADVHVSLHEIWEYNHKKFTLKTAPRDGILSYVKIFKGFVLFINGWNGRHVQFKNA